MKKFFVCISLVLTGLMTSCVDKFQEVDADSKPSWLGESIYAELKNANQERLTGTFSNYVRLIDDLGYAETLNRTGSKTIFPANDDAFARFFQKNEWGVTSYEQLTTSQKKLLLYSSMLDNALLIDMLSTASNGTAEPEHGAAVKHITNVSVIDTIQYMKSAEEMPKGNKYWQRFYEKGIHTVSDNTRPMMVHLTREYMLDNDITVAGNESDFAILTGTPYQEGTAYVFNNRVIKGDVTCQNGYIHQMEDVLVPPGNMAQVLRGDQETGYFSQVLDYYCAPYKNQSLTDAYNAWAEENGQPTIDMIYEVRYLEQPGHPPSELDPDGNNVSERTADLRPGMEPVQPRSGHERTLDLSLADIGTMFVPTDKAFTDFFCEGGDGAYLIDLYGKYTGSENNEAHLAENLDSLRAKRPDILTKFMNNLMSESFVATVPSKFPTILSDASEYKGISTDILSRKADGKYDIRFANNGVIYKMTEMIAPDEFQSVMAPSSVYPDMQVMNWAVQDDSKMRVSFHYYLMAMRANYAYFIPDDAAFEAYYVDPVYLKHEQPRVLKFYYDAKYPTQPVRCIAYAYNPETNEVGQALNNGANVDVASWTSQMIDIMNYHTVVLEDGEVLGTNKYYKTKHGGAVKLTGIGEGSQVLSGRQIDNGMEPSTITKVYPEKNGTAFRINHVIAAPTNSVSKTLKNNDRFSEFNRVCAGFSNSRLLSWAGISATVGDLGISEQDAYIIFTTTRNGIDGSSLDDEGGNVKMFNTFNYTLYAPNNEAMQKAYAAGLPSWDEISQLMADATNNEVEGAQLEAMKQEAKAKIDQLRDFARYHFQSTSVFADNQVATSKYSSLSTDDLGLALELKVSGGSGKLQVTDGAGQTHTIDANDPSRLSNLLARDYWFDANRANATSIYTTSFCVVHEISEPLNSGT